MQTMTSLKPTLHAIERYKERFAGNVSYTEARARLQRIACSAKREAVRRDGSILYRARHITLAVKERHIVTVY